MDCQEDAAFYFGIIIGIMAWNMLVLLVEGIRVAIKDPPKAPSLTDARQFYHDVVAEYATPGCPHCHETGFMPDGGECECVP